MADVTSRENRELSSIVNIQNHLIHTSETLYKELRHNFPGKVPSQISIIILSKLLLSKMNRVECKRKAQRKLGKDLFPNLKVPLDVRCLGMK